jgi:hypothetical protein
MESEDRERFIDEWLEGALERRGRAEPRPGLENRILANIKTERERVPVRVWSWWPVWAGAAAILLIGGMASVRRNHEVGLPVVSHVTAPAASKTLEPGITAAAKKSPRPSTRKPAAAPRREQFPSPQPLSEQEQILARYIQQFPREAVLVAQAQTELSKQEMIEQETLEQNR